MPIQAGAIVEVWDGLTLCLELDATALLDLLAMHVRTARLMALLLASAEQMPLARERLELALVRSEEPRAGRARARAQAPGPRPTARQRLAGAARGLAGAAEEPAAGVNNFAPPLAS